MKKQNPIKYLIASLLVTLSNSSVVRATALPMNVSLYGPAPIQISQNQRNILDPLYITLCFCIITFAGLVTGLIVFIKRKSKNAKKNN